MHYDIENCIELVNQKIQIDVDKTQEYILTTLKKIQTMNQSKIQPKYNPVKYNGTVNNLTQPQNQHKNTN